MKFELKVMATQSKKLVLFFLLSMPVAAIGIELLPWADGFDQITDVKFLETANQALISEKAGGLYLIDLKTKHRKRIKKFSVNTSSEMGLLGILPTKDALFVYYSPKGKSETRLSRFDLNVSGVMGSSEQILLTFIQPYSNHNGGALIKGPGNSILLSVGDGGAGGDPHNHGQNPQTLLGSIIRIIPDNQSPKGYRIPEGNLHEWVANAQPEILAMGLRNAWKMSMTSSGNLWIADVGQNAFEEINLVDAESIGSAELNLGWKILEGHSCYRTSVCQSSNYWSPVLSYSHQTYGQSITGGFVYEGSEVSELKGKYLFADFVSGFIGTISPVNLSKVEPLNTKVSGNWSTFARDLNGELYIADFSGKIYKIQPDR